MSEKGRGETFLICTRGSAFSSLYIHITDHLLLLTTNHSIHHILFSLPSLPSFASYTAPLYSTKQQQASEQRAPLISAHSYSTYTRSSSSSVSLVWFNPGLSVLQECQTRTRYLCQAVNLPSLEGYCSRTPLSVRAEVCQGDHLSHHRTQRLWSNLKAEIP